jgi:molecular chaperone GrpE
MSDRLFRVSTPEAGDGAGRGPRKFLLGANPVSDEKDLQRENVLSESGEAPAAGESASGAEAIDQVALDDLAAQLEAVTVERDRLAGENEELQDRLLRRQADFENFRRRVERERAEFAEYAAMEAVRALLPILDDFERALKAKPALEGPAAEYARGIEFIYQRLFDALKKLGLEPLESVGRPFDPNLHHAVETVADPEAGDHTVIEEYQKGYNFKGKLLRPAMVKVAVKPS